MGRPRWPGGWIHRQKNGRELFIIEKRINGKRFSLSTRAHSLRAALKQLERFEADPHGYRPEGPEPEAPIRMSAKLIDDYRTWQLEVKGVTPKHASETENLLEDWLEDLGVADLRKVTLRDHIKPALDRRRTCRPHRIIAIKAFYGWLRKERHLLISAQDPTLDLPVPQARPEKWVRRKAVPLDVVVAVAAILEPDYRDMITVLAGTGWHVTEIERFIRRPESEIVYARSEDTLATLVTRHKNRELTRVPVTDPDVLAAAERLRARGRVPKKANAAVKQACAKAKVKAFTLGVMRHSVATWAIERKAIPALVSEFLGHKDPRTTKRFYTDVAVPTATVPLPQLRVVQGGRTA